MANLNFRRSAIYNVHLTVRGSFGDDDKQFEMLVKSRSEVAAGRKAQRIAWKKMGYIFTNVTVNSSRKVTLWL